MDEVHLLKPSAIADALNDETFGDTSKGWGAGPGDSFFGFNTNLPESDDSSFNIKNNDGDDEIVSEDVGQFIEVSHQTNDSELGSRFSSLYLSLTEEGEDEEEEFEQEIDSEDKDPRPPFHPSFIPSVGPNSFAQPMRTDRSQEQINTDNKLPTTRVKGVMNLEELEAGFVSKQRHGVEDPRRAGLPLPNFPTQSPHREIVPAKTAPRPSPHIPNMPPHPGYHPQSLAFMSRPTSDTLVEKQRFFRNKRAEVKARMTNYDINNVVRLHSSQLQSESPYSEDYYYQSYLRFRKGREPPPHLALCETQPRVLKRKGDGPDPFEGALGRIPSHSVRCPRPLLQLDPHSDTPVAMSAGTRRSEMMENTEDAVHDLWDRQRVLLRAESAYQLALQCEDIDCILRGISADPSQATRLLEKRAAMATQLFMLLQVIPPPSTPPARAKKATPVDPQAYEDEDDTEFENLYSLPEDELFVKITQIPKGNRLLIRALPILSPMHNCYVLMTYMRNLHMIVTFPKSHEEVVSSSRLCLDFVTLIGTFPFRLVTLCLHTFILYQQVEAIKTKNGTLLLRAIFTRAYQLASEIMKSLDPALVLELKLWESTFAAFMDGLDGYFVALLRLSMEEEQLPVTDTNIFVRMVHVWDFLLHLTLHTKPEQNLKVFTEIREIAEECLEQGTPHRDFILSLLTRLGVSQPRPRFN